MMVEKDSSFKTRENFEHTQRIVDTFCGCCKSKTATVKISIDNIYVLLCSDCGVILKQML